MLVDNSATMSSKTYHKCTCVAVREIRDFTLTKIRQTNPNLTENEIKMTSQEVIRCVSEALKKDLRLPKWRKIAKREGCGNKLSKAVDSMLPSVKKEEVVKNTKEVVLPDLVNTTFTIRKQVVLYSQEILESVPISVEETTDSEEESLKSNEHQKFSKNRLKKIFHKIINYLTPTLKQGVQLSALQPSVEDAIEAVEEEHLKIQNTSVSTTKNSSKAPKCRIPVRIPNPGAGTATSASRLTSSSCSTISANSPGSEALGVLPEISHKVRDLKSELASIESALNRLKRPMQSYAPAVF